MIQVRKRATPEQIEDAVRNLRVARDAFLDVFCGDTTVLTILEQKKCMRIDSKIHRMIIDLIDAYKDRAG